MTMPPAQVWDLVSIHESPSTSPAGKEKIRAQLADLGYELELLLALLAFDYGHEMPQTTIDAAWERLREQIDEE